MTANPEAAQEMTPPLRMLTVAQAAETLQLSDWTVRELLKSGALQGRKIRHSWRIHPDVLDAYMREGAA